MTGNDKKERAALDRLAETLVDDILSASDEEILAEFRATHGDPDAHAAAMRALFEKSVVVANKRRLAAAKAGAAASRRAGAAPGVPVDIAGARARLRAALDAPGASQKLTLAARKEGELSDADIAGMLDDLAELGLLPTGGGDQGGKI